MNSEKKRKNCKTMQQKKDEDTGEGELGKKRTY